MMTTLRVTAAAAQNDAQLSVVFTESSQEQDQEDETSRDAPLKDYHRRTNDSTYNPKSQ